VQDADNTVDKMPCAGTRTKRSRDQVLCCDRLADDFDADVRLPVSYIHLSPDKLHNSQINAEETANDRKVCQEKAGGYPETIVTGASDKSD
jgi:hypothetical protein